MNEIINKEKVRKRFEKSIASYNNAAMVQRSIARELIQKIMDLDQGDYSRVLEIGCGTGFLTNELLQFVRPEYYLINDLVESMRGEIENITKLNEFSNWSFISGDAESLSITGTFDLVVSASTIQWFHDIISFFHSAHRILSNKGVLAFSTFGTDNFKEIKSLQQSSLQYPSLGELVSLLSPNFEILHSSEKILQLLFETPMDALKHIKQTGVNAISDKYLNKSTLLNLQTNYSNYFSNPDGTVGLTYHPIIVIAKKK
jgi:malonyl-ACP O-methyltransferase BioC